MVRASDLLTSAHRDTDEDGSMDVLPRTRRSRVIASVLLVALLVAAWINRDALTFAAKLAVPGPGLLGGRRPDLRARRGRSGARAPRRRRRGPAHRRVRPSRSDRGSTSPGASALADPAGPGPGARDDARRPGALPRSGRRHQRGRARHQRPHHHGRRARPARDRHRPGRRPAVPRLHRRRAATPRSGRGRSTPTACPEPGGGVLHLEIGQPFQNHNGGNLVFGPDGALWIGTGDGGGAGDRGEVAQDDGSLLGKMLRVVPDPDGGVLAPTSNPDWERPEIWGIGLRNPWRYSFDREHGPALDRRRRPEHHRGGVGGRPRRRPTELRVGHGRGGQRLRGRAPARLHDAGGHLRPRRRAARSPAATCTAARPYPTCTAGTCSATTAVGSSARSRPTTRRRTGPARPGVGTIVSFGELEDGELRPPHVGRRPARAARLSAALSRRGRDPGGGAAVHRPLGAGDVAASSDARKATTAAISSGRPNRPSGRFLAHTVSFGS